MDDLLLIFLVIIIGIFLAVIVLFKPYLGIGFTISSLAIIDLLPEIPFFSSVVPLIGAVTIIGFLFKPRRKYLKLEKIHLVSLLFVVWIFISNPEAAWFGSSRNWLFTFLQLWVLLFLAGDLLDTPKKQKVVILLFSVVSIASAFYAIFSGGIGEDFSSSIRARGFTDNANAAARFFVVAMVFITYFRSAIKQPFLRFLSLIGILITYLGVFFTVSRTGIILLFSAQILIFIMQTKGKQKFRLLTIYVVLYLILWLLSDSIFDIIGTIIPTIVAGEDTFGLRLNLWRSGWVMWTNHPIRGVGIGMFINSVGPIIQRFEGPHVWNAVAHNTYVQVLSETGIIGFILFISMIIITLKNYWTADLSHDTELSSLRNTWLIVFIVMLIGGLTKSDHADKLSWMVMGISVFFANVKLFSTQKQNIPKSQALNRTTSFTSKKQLKPHPISANEEEKIKA